MKIIISSNLVSGLYTCLEMFIALALARFIRIILECFHIKKLYDDGKEIRVTSSRLDILASHGITTRNNHRVAFCISAAVIILTAIGGFSIVGETGKDFEHVRVRNLVKKASPGSVLDYEQHASFEKNLVSSAVLLTFNFVQCAKATPDELTVYQFANNLEDLSTPKWHLKELLLNSTCITEESGFADQVAMRLKRRRPRDKSADNNCSWSISPHEIPFRKFKRVAPKQTKGCRFENIETWCLRDEGVFCGTLTRFPDGYGTSVSHFYNGTHRAFNGYSQVPERVESARLKVMVSIMAIGIFRMNPDYLYLMSSLSVETGASVRKFRGNRDETSIDLRLLLISLVPALVMTLMAGVLSFFAWVKVLVLPGRLKYNRFNTAMDLLSFAAAEAFDDGGYNIRRHREVTVGVSRKEPHVGPLKESDREHELCFHEEELMGRAKNSLTGVQKLSASTHE